MADYFVSAAGSDANAGTTAGAPWKTITNLNNRMTYYGIVPGDRIWLKSGDWFPGRLRTPTTYTYGTPGVLTIGRYGDSDELPVIHGFKYLNIASGWVQHDADTWKLNYTAANAGITYTGYDSAQDFYWQVDDVALLVIDGVIKPAKRFTLGQLVNQWDYYSAGGVLYVRSAAKPTTLAADIRCTTDGDGFQLTTAVAVDHLHFTGHGGSGAQVSSTGLACERGSIMHCEFDVIGGSYLDGFGAGDVRYGNGINVWTSTKNVDCEYNRIHDCYDVAWSIQGGTDGAATSFENVGYRHNLTYRNSQSEEYWYKGNGGGFVNCLSEYNTNLFAGYGFGADARPEQYNRVHVLNYNWGDLDSGYHADLKLRRNIYYDAYGQFSYSPRVPLGLTAGPNVIALRHGTPMDLGGPTVEQAHDWTASAGREQKSQIHILPASAGTQISNADVMAAIAHLDTVAAMGQRLGNRVIPIHSPWRTLALPA
jgi:hypothetical protein